MKGYLLGAPPSLSLPANTTYSDDEFNICQVYLTDFRIPFSETSDDPRQNRRYALQQLQEQV